MSAICIALLSAAAPCALSAVTAEYDKEIAAAEKTWMSLAMAKGKDAAISKLRDIIDRYPNGSRNLYLEYFIGQVYELSGPGKEGQPQKAVEVYVGALQKYGKNNRYASRVLVAAGGAASRYDAELGASFYSEVAEREPAVTKPGAESRVALAKRALERHEKDKAVALLTEVLACEQPNKPQEVSPEVEEVRTRAAGALLDVALAEPQPCLRLEVLHGILDSSKRSLSQDPAVQPLIQHVQRLDLEVMQMTEKEPRKKSPNAVAADWAPVLTHLPEGSSDRPVPVPVRQPDVSRAPSYTRLGVVLAGSLLLPFLINKRRTVNQQLSQKQIGCDQ